MAIDRNAEDMPRFQENLGAVSLLDVLRGMWRRRRRLIVVSTALFALLGWLFISVSTPHYTGEAQILVEYEDTPYTRADGQPLGGALAPRIGDREVKSQVAVLKSRDMALKVLRDLGLVGTPEFDPLKKGIGWGARLKIALGFSADPRNQTPEQRALDAWFKRLKVYDLPGTKVIVISFNSESPKTAAAVANALAETYVEQTRRSQLEKTGEAREWLREQIDKLRRKVVEAEVAVERFRARAGLFQGTQAKLHNQQLSELSAQIVQAAAERSRLQARARTIRELLRRGEVDKSAEVLQSPLIQRLREQQVQLKRRLAELSTVYLDNHPRVRAVRRELADLKRQIHVEARKIAEALEQQARIAANREVELRKQLEQLKRRVSTAQIDEVKLRELEREARANRALLESFLARYSDALTRKDAQALPRMARVISRAAEPSMPTFPKVGPVMILATLAGFVLGLGLAFVLEVMAAIREAEDAARAPRAGVHDAVIAMSGGGGADFSIGKEGLQGEAVAERQAPPAREGSASRTSVPVNEVAGDGRATEWSATLASRLSMGMDEGCVIALATLMQDVDASAEAARVLARELAARCGPTLIVDADMEEALLSADDAGAGLSDVLAGRARFSEAVRASGDRLHFMPAGAALQEVRDLPGNTAFRQLLEALRPHYARVVLMEGMPKFPAQEMLSVLPVADVAVVLHDDDARMREIAEALHDALRQAARGDVIVQPVPRAASSAAGVRMAASG